MNTKKVHEIDFVGLTSQAQRLKDIMPQYLDKVFEHGRFIAGPEVKALEERLKNVTETTYCVSCGNGTDAIQIALMALGVGSGDEVIIPAFSFIATGEAVRLLGATIVFGDIDPDTFNLETEKLEDLITSRTKAIIAVSLYGQCADFDAINSIADRYGIAVIEDAAQSFGARYRGRHSCALTTIACTSFFPTKPLGAYGDGGALFSTDERLATRMREIANHGQSQRYYHRRLGLNSRLDTIQAAVLLAKLEIFSAEIEKRQVVASYYRELIEANFQCGSISLPAIAKENESVWAQYTVRVANRSRVRAGLKAYGIPTAVHYPLPLHHQPALQDRVTCLPHSEKAAMEVLCLPMHPYLERSEQKIVIETLKAIVSR